VGSRQGDSAVLAEEEVNALKKKLDGRVHEVELKVLLRPSRKPGAPAERRLDEQYAAFKPHVFHFIGHGKLVPSQVVGDPAESILLLHDEDTHENVEWRQVDIISDLAQHEPLFVFLNACHTVDASELGTQSAAEARRERSEAAWSISDTFLESIRARAVLGMHAAVRGDSAGILAAKLYDQVIAGNDLDVALTQARIEVDRLRGKHLSRYFDWALPYLRVKVPPEQVLGMAPLVPRLVFEATQVDEFYLSSFFVNRIEDRRKLLDSLQSDPKRKTNLVMVKGSSKVGKTDLIRCCLKWAACRGRLVKYVQLDEEAEVDDLELLRLMCEGEPSSLIGKPLPAKAMERFYKILNTVLDGGDSSNSSIIGAASPEPKWDDEYGRRVLPRRGRARDPVSDLYQGFLQALERVPNEARAELANRLEQSHDPNDKSVAARVRDDERPFLLVIDQISQKSVNLGTFNKTIVPNLLQPIAGGLGANFVVILGIKDEKANPLELKKLELAAPPVELEAFSAGELVGLAGEYFQKLLALPKYSAQGLDPVRLNTSSNFWVQQFTPGNLKWNPDLLWPLVRMTYFPANPEAQP
jgi:hypothetical protein